MRSFVAACAAFALTVVAAPAASAQSGTFFLTSKGPGNGANLGGLKGADKHCEALAKSANLKGKGWRAYLSAAPDGGKKGVNAKDRIGKGPWFNVKGVKVAENVADLHSDKNKLSKENSITEKGEGISGRGDTPNRHDILTGSKMDGTVADGEPAKATCGNWTLSGEGSTMLGHHDRVGGGANGTSWNAAHPSRGCSQENLRATGGDGLFYCFATK